MQRVQQALYNIYTLPTDPPDSLCLPGVRRVAAERGWSHKERAIEKKGHIIPESRHKSPIQHTEKHASSFLLFTQSWQLDC